MNMTPKPRPKSTTKRAVKSVTLPARLDRVRRKAGLTEYGFAKVLGMSQQQYYNMKTNSQRVTKAWEIALTAMEKYGLDFLSPETTRLKK